MSSSPHPLHQRPCDWYRRVDRDRCHGVDCGAVEADGEGQSPIRGPGPCGTPSPPGHLHLPNPHRGRSIGPNQGTVS
ncbi:hypothetical protein NHX12_018364 [Muraenolepis orangiensis]|uniref:Uncharacterized protein n=1 Tax=Muraenolepis orangiensis TaxID=630683 RepID=A0A9Q0EX33_9TELE|nr:hypothetical protein NHX12_018364 [Muraenolepis orangiensis]